MLSEATAYAFIDACLAFLAASVAEILTLCAVSLISKEDTESPTLFATSAIESLIDFNLLLLGSQAIYSSMVIFNLH
ncbi:hypothetical protein D3C84_1167650 [compost metagenome]